MMNIASLGLPIAFDSPLPPASLNLSTKIRGNPLPWRGQFSPELVDCLLQSYAPPGSLVLDPFVGSGTVLFEAARLGYEVAGVEINPAAATLARLARFANAAIASRRRTISAVDDLLKKLHLLSGPLFLPSGCTPATLEEAIDALLEYATNCSDDTRWLIEALVIRVDLGNGAPDCSRLLSVWNATKRLVLSLPEAEGPIHVFLRDARDIPLADQSVQFVLTSPPYINVFNYHHNYRRSAERLGWKPLLVARSELGSNRKFRQNRFLTVIQYCLDISQVLCEIHRVCSPDGRVIFVVGRESNVQKTPFFNGDIVRALAEATSRFTPCLVQERVFQNRFGSQIYEDLIHLQPSRIPQLNSDQSILDCGRRVALEALTDASSRVPSDRSSDLQDAIEAITSVQPSLQFSSREAKNASNSSS